MKTGYKYLGAVWPSPSDCEEIALSLFQEKVYNYAMRRCAFGVPDWKRRTNDYERHLIDIASRERGWKEVTIMD